MIIILNDFGDIRVSNYCPDQEYNLEDIFFYISRKINIKNLHGIFDLEHRFEFTQIEYNKNYYIYKADPVNFPYFSGYHYISICYNNILSAPAKIKLFNCNAPDFDDSCCDNGEASNGCECCTSAKPAKEVEIIDFSMLEPDEGAHIEDKFIKLEGKTLVQGDANSTYITFTLNKTYDGINLFDQNCHIKMVQSQTGESSIVPFEPYQYIDNEDETFSFTWILNSFATQSVGELLFALGFGLNTTGYVWKSAPAKLLIQEGVVTNTDGEEAYIEVLKDWLDSKEAQEENVDMVDEHPPICIDKDKEIHMCCNRNPIVQGENRSQLITFKVYRFADGVDLDSKIITIKYETPCGTKMRARAVNKVTTDNSIIFSWLIRNSVTREAGDVKFSIEIIGDVAQDEKDYYVWQTLPATLTILEGLEDGDYTDEPSESAPDWILWLENQIDFLRDEVNAYKVLWGGQ